MSREVVFPQMFHRRELSCSESCDHHFDPLMKASFNLLSNAFRGWQQPCRILSVNGAALCSQCQTIICSVSLINRQAEHHRLHNGAHPKGRQP